MPLAPGTRLRSYSIVSLVGAGGMGEVYHAYDDKLRREVALKILPQSVATDREARTRLVREAHVLATLNHPAIAAIYDLEDVDGIVALVLEFVAGPTLAETIAAGPIEVATAVRIAGQIVDALDAAHENGIVHRDLKPGNIKLTVDGRVKILDFGIAKVVGAESRADLTMSPTITSLASRMGVILGTPSYMSPEQAKGRAVDKRVDIWAFGCVLFEMLTGRSAFAGDDVTDLIVAVMTKEPDWSLLPPTTPPRITALLKKCLKRDPRERVRDIADVREDLGAATESKQTPPPASDHGYTSQSVRFQRLTDFVGLNESPAISPDGKMLAFVTSTAGRRQIWIRLLSGGTPLQVTRANVDHEQPRWAPDSSALIYYTPAGKPGTAGMLWEVSALGGTPRPIATALGGGDISHDGRRIAVFQAVDDRVELALISRDGSTTTYVRPLPSLVSCDCPRWSPDDRSIAFQAHVIAYFDQRIFVVPSLGGQAHDLVHGMLLRGLAWLPDGRGLVYSSSAGSSLPYPPTFNLRAIDLEGTRDRQVTFGDASHVEPDVHDSGKLLTSRIRSRSDIWRIPISGSPAQNAREAVRVTHQSGRVQTPSISPDGREIVYLSDSGGHGNLWVTSSDGLATRQITFEHDSRNTVGVPVWSPVGKRIAFLMTREGEARLWSVNADGSELRQLHAHGYFACWSGDGEWLYCSPPNQRPWRILKVPMDGGEPIEVRSDNAMAPAISRDGSVLYYWTAIKPDVGTLGDLEIRAARPESGATQTLARVAGSRIPVSSVLIHMFLSPDESCLAIPLTNGTTTNLWILPTDGGTMQPVTDFGETPITISRRIAWAPDGKALYAALEESDADIVSLEGLLG